MTNLGVLLTSSYEFLGRYARWTVGFTAPALQIEGMFLLISMITDILIRALEYHVDTEIKSVT